MTSNVINNTEVEFIFIGGASASGKSTLSRALVERLQAEGKSCQAISLDDYFRTFSEEKYNEIFNKLRKEKQISDTQTPEEQAAIVFEHYRGSVNFDVYSMLNTELLSAHLSDLNQGKTINKGKFDFSTHRYTAYETREPTEFIVIDGLYATRFARTLGPEFKKTTVFTSTSEYFNIIKRRVARDIQERPLEKDVTKRNEEKEKKAVMKMLNQYVSPAFFGFPDPRAGESLASSMLGVDIHILNDDDKEKTDIKNGVEEILYYLDGRYKADLLRIVKADWRELEHLSEKFRSDKEIVLTAIREAGFEALQFAADELKYSKRFQAEAALYLVFDFVLRYPKTSAFMLGLVVALITLPFTTLATAALTGFISAVSFFGLTQYQPQTEEVLSDIDETSLSDKSEKPPLY